MRIVGLLTFFLLFTSGCGSSHKFSGVHPKHTDVESIVSGVTSGSVKAEKEAQLAFGLVGRIKAINIELGAKVIENEILAELENEDLRTTLNYARAEEERAQSLYKSKLISPSDLEKATSTLDSANITYEKSLIRAPFDGIITELNLEVGQLAQITMPNPEAMMRIVDTDPRYVEVEIDEVDLAKLKTSQDARIKILAVRKEPLDGKVRRIVPYVSSAREQDRTVLVEINIENSPILLPVGASADVELIVDKHTDTLAVPTRCILGHGNQRYVYILDGETTKKKPVTIDLSNYDKTEITSGLTEKDLVIMPSDKVDLEENLKGEITVEEWL